MNFADISTAVNRWIVTVSMINAVLETVYMKNINSEEKKRNSCVQRDNNYLKTSKGAMTSRINPSTKNR